MWQCVKCREKVVESFDVCWKCGTSRDGTEDPTFRAEIDSDPVAAADAEEGSRPASSPIYCPRCDRPLDYVGTKAFHEGTRWGILGDVGELFVNRERFD